MLATILYHSLLTINLGLIIRRIIIFPVVWYGNDTLASHPEGRTWIGNEFYLSLVYLTMLSVTQTIKCPRVGWLMGNELKRMWKEVVVT
jgi:hypothetical protein